MRDEQGRRVLFGWLREDRDAAALQMAGWAGVMSLPRILSLRSDHTLSIEPTAELTRLRHHQHRVAPQFLESNGLVSEQVSSSNNALEIILEVEYSLSSHCGLCIQDRSYPNERLQINLQARGLSIEQTQGNQQSSEQCVLEPGRHKLHIFIDGSVMEIIIDNKSCLTERFYHSAPQQLTVSVFSNEGGARLHQWEIWELAN
jgi:beta-fructofuranosidase